MGFIDSSSGRGWNHQGDYSGRHHWPGDPQANWPLTWLHSGPKWLGEVTTVNIALDRDKPIPLARQIQAHLERLIRERLLTPGMKRSEEHTSELQSQSNLVCRLLLEKKKALPQQTK